jgi:hypothetical protein
MWFISTLLLLIIGLSFHPDGSKDEIIHRHMIELSDSAQNEIEEEEEEEGMVAVR